MESQSVMSLSSSGARRGGLADEGDENEKSSNMVALSRLAISLQGDRSNDSPSAAAWIFVEQKASNRLRTGEVSLVGEVVPKAVILDFLHDAGERSPKSNKTRPPGRKPFLFLEPHSF